MTEGKNDMTEDDRALRILRTLPDEPPAPSTVDVPRTMAEGRRRRRVRRWSGGVALAAVTAVAAGGGTVGVAALRDTPAPAPTPSTPAAPISAAAAPTPAPTGCKVTVLPTGGVTKALVTAGDPSGRYHAGRVYPPQGAVRTVLWKDGVLQKLPAMPGSDASFDDINSSGVAVGSSFDDREQQGAYVLAGGAVTRLPGGDGTVAVAINDAGVIAGTSGGTPARWASPTAAPAKLPLPGGFTGGGAGDIDRDGTIVGSVHRANGEGTGYLWFTDGTGRLMPLPEVDGAKATLFWPESISDGVVLGRAVLDSPDGSSRSFASYRYRIAANRYEKLPVALDPPALGAENGWVLGTTGRYEPVVIAGKKVVKLPRYQQMKEYVVSGFSADGKVAAGYTTDSTDDEGVANRPLRWTCR